MSEAPKGMTALSHGVENGVQWATVRAPLWGAVNGYALLPEGHPWRELSLQSHDCDKGPDVHGGITYGPEPDGWVGFDYLHAGDAWPKSPINMPGDRMRTEAEVEEEAKSLARQIAAVSA